MATDLWGNVTKYKHKKLHDYDKISGKPVFFSVVFPVFTINFLIIFS